jgi:hypothetical protein
MWISQSYARPSSAQSSETATSFSLSTQEGRPPVALKARIKNSPDYARAMLALFEVVQGDERFAAKDHTAYQEWVRAEYLKELAPQLEATRQKLPAQLEQKNELQERIALLEAEAKPYRSKLQSTQLWDAKRKYWQWLYSRHRELWILLDPVVSVHPDAVIFEVFSQDESSYGRVSVDFSNLETEGETVFGTTNVDFSDQLADEIRRVRSYRPANLEVGGGGVSIGTDAGTRVEKKIDLPESWVRGFLQVQSAGTFPNVALTLSASTVAEMLMILKRDREKISPRALKFVLENGAKPKLVLEPWNIEIEEPTHVFNGDSQEIRIWGRRRLFALEALLAYADDVQIRLLGTGMPHFWSVTANGHRFDVGLSGWTKNDWSSAARFDLLASTASVSQGDIELARGQLEKSLRLSPEELAAHSDLSREAATSALQQICKEGDAMYDAIGGFYRWRKLLPPGVEAVKPKPDPRVEYAKRIVAAGGVAWRDADEEDSEFGLKAGSTRILSTVSSVNKEGSTRNQAKFEVTVDIDGDGRASFASCTCNQFRKDKLKKGPCSHILATTALASARVTGLRQAKQAGAKASFDPEQFAGLSFCFTGALSVYGREQAENLVAQRGGKAASGVSKNLSYLVVGERAGSKLMKAKLLGVKVLTEAEFKVMLEGGQKP